MSHTALLVDDEQGVRAYVSAVLRQAGYRVVAAADASEALSILHRTRGGVGVLVTDINMPQMTGIELVNAMRIDFPYIPVVYISGDQSNAPQQDPRSGCAFVLKPFGPKALLDAVRSVVTRALSAGGVC